MRESTESLSASVSSSLDAMTPLLTLIGLRIFAVGIDERSVR
ncbi:hypothetical protein MA4S0726RB_3766 [Mycobacteroides abscessus 4S-0726-RB]|nr:hypothetical protein MA4S0726RB_3766 [Mycobacteroides abscessus 4S-0726-RB]EIV60412.1 hypothetical protein MA4S0116S_3314 [Mycobacteroides abscessus 4S-0116-S]